MPLLVQTPIKHYSREYRPVHTRVCVCLLLMQNGSDVCYWRRKWERSLHVHLVSAFVIIPTAVAKHLKGQFKRGRDLSQLMISEVYTMVSLQNITALCGVKAQITATAEI